MSVCFYERNGCDLTGDDGSMWGPERKAKGALTTYCVSQCGLHSQTTAGLLRKP